MHDWRDFVIRHLTSFESLDELAIAAALLGLAMFVLPRSERRQLRLPILLLALYMVLIVGHQFLFGPISPHSKLAFISLVLLLVPLTRIAFLVVVDWLLVRWLRRDIPRIFREIVQALLFLVMAFVLFRSLGAELSSLLTTSAILTAVVGLSLQESLGNLVAGLAVRAEHPFEVGDWVELVDGNKTCGSVVEINWRATKLRTADHYDVVVPNGLFAKSTFRNYGRPDPVTRRTVDFQGPYDISPDRIRQVVTTALRGCPGMLANPAPRLWVAGFGDSGVNYQVNYFLDDFSIRLDVESNIRTRIWYALRRAKIAMPYPVRDVRMQTTASFPTPQTLEQGLEHCVDVLRRIPLFDGMPDPELRALAECAETVLYSTGESVLFEGDTGNDLFVVARGEVAAITHLTNGEQVELARIGQGDVFGELSLLTGVRGATITATEETRVLRIGHDDFRRIVAKVDGFAEALLARLMERQNQLSRRDELELDSTLASAGLRTALLDRIRRFFSA